MTLAQAQIADRAKGLGGSDIGAIVGVNPYKTAHDVYNDKMGLVPPFQGNDFTEFGNRLESVILDWYNERAPMQATHCEHLIHPEFDWMRGIPDAIVLDENGKPTGIVEAKTAHWRTADQWGESGTDSVPDSYLVQCAWYMALADVMWCDLVVLLDREFRSYRMKRDMAMERRLIELGREFWENHIVPGVPPAVDGSDGCSERLALNAADDGEIAATEDMDGVALELHAVSEELKALEAKKKHLRNQLADMLGSDAKKAKGEWGSFYWTAPKPKPTTDWQAVASEIGAPDEIVAKHTRETCRKPSFTVRFKKGLGQ